MGLFDSKSSIIGSALGVSGAFDKSRKTDKAAAFGATLGASIGSGQKWTMADSLRLGAAISALDAGKEDSTSSYAYSSSHYSNDCEVEECSSDNYSSNMSSQNEYDDLILTSEQEEQLEEAGIDTFDFECMNDDEKMEALEEVGLDPFDFDMY